MPGALLMTNDTVAWEQPASRAISVIVTRRTRRSGRRVARATDDDVLVPVISNHKSNY
jgi:hypothetical protein